jgi:ATP-dependent DNA helicase RecG
MYGDRLEIVSPGGMYDGKMIQKIDIDTVASVRRNPILADILSRIDYMERRGSGLKRMKESFKDKSLLKFYSNQTNFFVIMRKQIVDEIANERIMSGYL